MDKAAATNYMAKSAKQGTDILLVVGMKIKLPQKW